ncbi:uncharacterized protein HMPREF1541_10590 [Cyphellophora europaea CBS 101466]|uniref:Vacuolar sorting protein Vps3844 C-terminal domain-containing protein n=1 Tax=Cyphellophora europaea (strain CBS 101466) TaxID=1220924 RepID=W2S721_CYPE1|nr:uncharacterized protein HMPREF1541_10590 [Cyphellophora europaea CBS 101466]ETN44410.1 hypothetical protein HMPREF1541_10590 [Cyphellophora europaea CBS 101466]
MKLTTLLACGAALAGSAAAQGGYIYTIDKSVISSSTASIDAETASAILARRRGLTGGRTLGTSDDSILEALKNYGGWQQPLFGATDEEAPGKLFIRIPGFDGQIMDLTAAMPDLWVEGPTTDLKSDFKAQPQREDGICEYAVPISNSNKDIEVVFSYPAEGDLGCLDPSEVPHLPITLAVQSVLPTSPSSIPSTIMPLKRILTHLLATQGVESTILLLPSSLSLSKPKSHEAAHELRRRTQPEETPLALSPDIKSHSTLLASNNTSNTTQPLPRNIPACFTSLASCSNTTNSCSGHGDCFEARPKCFRCKCGTTVVREDSEGRKKTVQWGGGACEKKDVSVPFVLFASFAVVIAALIAGVIGMMASMGAQKLPSVLSAGVAGPTARK